MKRILGLIIALLLVTSTCFADVVMSGAKIGTGPKQVIGLSTVGTTEGNTASSFTRCAKVTTVNAMSLLYAWQYAKANTTPGTTSFCVYNSARDTQVGACSNSITLPTSYTWNKVTFSPPISLAATTDYFLCPVSVPGSGNLYFYYTTGAVNSNYTGTGTTCPSVGTSGDTQVMSVCGANYDLGL